ncbi:hypothetical protein HRJ41_12270 [Pseudomonas sp. BF61]|uniref:hypothetical protein n=1 Tax=Pseudomonas sp. BF61 TaxID=2741068 RepID=UPI001C0DD1B5|nr:hypothetical protein [Pseudomonas sp. BF61]MBU4628269.1 hypothetical protein [Pseudomonas sp. BF61]
MTWYQNILSFLSPGWVGSLIGLLGLLSVPVVYLMARKRTSLAFAYAGDHLLGSSSNALPRGISVQYNGNNIPRLTRSVIALWNNGENTLSGSDIVGADPLRFEVGSDGAILSVTLLQLTRPVNGVHLATPPAHAPNEAYFGFNFLDKGDGVVIEILHTSENRQPTIKGTLKGMPKGPKSFGRIIRSGPISKNNNIKRNVMSRGFSRVTSYAIVWLPIVAGMSAIATSGIFTDPPIIPASPPKSDPIFYIGLGATYILMGLFMANKHRRRYPKQLHVEALE